jgi:hypothetical protein
MVVVVILLESRDSMGINHRSQRKCGNSWVARLDYDSSSFASTYNHRAVVLYWTFCNDIVDLVMERLSTSNGSI